MKYILSALYAAMIGTAMFYHGTQLSTVMISLLIIFVLIHFIEFLIKRPILKRAGGSMLMHFIQTIIFGFAHWQTFNKNEQD